VEDSQPTSQEMVRVLAALSDENRFRIVSLLAGEEGELTCGAIGKALDLSPSLLSHHLSILAQAGIVGRRKSGLWTMNVLERPVIERQLAALESLLGRNGVGTAGVNGDGGAERAVAAPDDGVMAGS
jgi:ArsR family transcriptional regulator, arsenate/arsenite/antimonite-responsive transcriptional repressor